MQLQQSLLSQLSFAALCSYSPHGNGPQDLQSQDLTYRLKNGGIVSVSGTSIPIARWIAQRVKTGGVAAEKLNEFFSPSTLLVPVPRSSLMKKGMLWVPMQMVEALSEVGLGRVAPLLYRTEAIPKAARSISSERPKAERHFLTIGVRPHVEISSDYSGDMLIVDDVITAGATMLGSASRIKASFPKCRVKGFAGVRTVSLPSTFMGFVDPRVGQISLGPYGRTIRSP